MYMNILPQSAPICKAIAVSLGDGGYTIIYYK